MFARSRQRGAALLTLLAIWATQLLPLLHQLGHRFDHVHGPHGQLHYFPDDIVTTQAAEDWHQHGGGAAHHHAQSEGGEATPESDAEPGDPRPTQPSDHGAGSLEHFQATWIASFEAPELILGAARLLQYLAPVEQLSLCARRVVESPRVRGPPRTGGNLQ
ncbi:MAG: hypothetical protein RJA70_4106 [Pseudomonadota bacterium]